MGKIKSLFVKSISIFKKKQYIVANSGCGLIVYDEQEYDKVIEGLDYVVPLEIKRFTSWKKALAYCKQHSIE